MDNKSHRYYLSHPPGGIPIPGHLVEELARYLGPDPAKLRSMLLDIQNQTKLPRSAIAGLLGVTSNTLVKWQRGTRSPCMSARRVIWMLWALIFEPELLSSVKNFAGWGRL